MPNVSLLGYRSPMMFQLKIFIFVQFAFVLTIAAEKLPEDIGNIQVTRHDGLPSEVQSKPFVKIGENYYFIDSVDKVNWYEASNICRRQGAHLASIETAAEMKALSDHLLARGFENHLSHWFWLSGTDNGNEGHFTWAGTGDAISFADWSSPQPDNAGDNENCVNLWVTHLGKFQMNDWRCTGDAYYICEKSAPKSISFTAW